jgi:hypothetical protein
MKYFLKDVTGSFYKSNDLIDFNKVLEKKKPIELSIIENNPLIKIDLLTGLIFVNGKMVSSELSEEEYVKCSFFFTPVNFKRVIINKNVYGDSGIKYINFVGWKSMINEKEITRLVSFDEFGNWELKSDIL